MIVVYESVFLITSLIIFINISSIIKLPNMALNNNINNRFILSIIGYIISSVLFVLSDNFIVNPAVNIIPFMCYYIFLTLSLILYNKGVNIVKIVYIVSVYLLLDSITRAITRYCVYNILTIGNNVLNDIVISFLINLIFCFFITLIMKKHYTIFNFHVVSSKIYILILFSFTFSSALIENQLVNTEKTFIQNEITKALTIICILLLIGIIVSLLITCVSKAYFESSSNILEKQVNEQINHYKMIDKYNKDIREFKHDYRNHLICLNALLDKGEIDDARSYINSITNQNIIESNFFYTGNEIADALFNDKLSIGEKDNIIINFEGSISDNIPVPDLCIILSNALDNAIDACKKITKNMNKIIDVKCAFIHNVQIIQIINPVEDSLEIKNNVISTSKKDKINHGFGLYNIKKTVDKYNGDFNIKYENEQFILEIGFQV